MATVQDIFLQELLRAFSGGIPVYGGTAQTGAITGNPTGSSGTGSSYSSGGSAGSNDPYAGVTVVYNPVTGQITTTDPSLTQEILTLNPQNPNIVVGEELVLIFREKLTLELEEGRIIRPLTVEFEEATIVGGPNHGRLVSDVVDEQPSSGESSPEVVWTVKRGGRVCLQKDGMVVSYEFDAYFGTSGHDAIKGGGLLLGYDGNDGLTGGIGNDTLDGGMGNDHLTAGSGADILNGGSDNDWLDGGAGADLIDGGAGWDVNSHLSATSGVIIDLTTNLNGGAAAGDRILNVEVLQGSNHNDRLTSIDRGNGHGAQLYGEGGDDGLVGRGGGDYLFGGAGNDWLDGGAGGDNIDGGEGWDVLSYQSATSGVAVNLASNANGGAAAGDTLSNIEVVQGSNHADSLVGVDRGGGHGVELHGEGGHDNMRGAAGGDRLYGGAGNDWMAGLAGADLVQGGDGDDVVGGQEGNDTLSGGYGTDELWGGSGADIFLFDTAVGAGADRLKDFAAAEGDMIRLNHNIFSTLSVGLLGSAFKVGAATSASHHILYNSATGDLSYDVDGSGSAAAVKIAMLNPGTTLSAFNFFVL